MKDAARFWVEHDLGGLECLRATYVRHRFAPHAHEEFAIGVIEAGAQRVRYRGGHEIMPERSLCVINPGEPHTGHAATGAGWTYSMIYPGEDLLAGAAAQVRDRPGGVPYCASLVMDDAELAGEFLRFHRALASGQASRLAKQTLLSRFLSQLVTRHAGVRPGRPAHLADAASARPGILRARDYLREHYVEEAGLDFLAGLANLSPFHFARSFRKAVGMAPHAYQLHLRLGRAKELLARGETIAQAAAHAGFTDQSHLTNRFRATLGITPGQYLAQYRVGATR
jgi:AraC-like DNA-binding protein